MSGNPMITANHRPIPWVAYKLKYTKYLKDEEEGGAVGNMECREGCGACCISPSISSAIPGMPDGKPAGVKCIQLDHNYRCRLYGGPERPAVCSNLRPSVEMCGDSRQEAANYLDLLERQTK